MMRDRSDEDTLRITQDLLAEMLGAQRPSITNAARELEHAGLIERGRREVTILDRRPSQRHLVNVINWFANGSPFISPKHIRTYLGLGNLHYRRATPVQKQASQLLSRAIASI